MTEREYSRASNPKEREHYSYSNSICFQQMLERGSLWTTDLVSILSLYFPTSLVPTCACESKFWPKSVNRSMWNFWNIFLRAYATSTICLSNRERCSQYKFCLSNHLYYEVDATCWGLRNCQKKKSWNSNNLVIQPYQACALTSRLLLSEREISLYPL